MSDTNMITHEVTYIILYFQIITYVDVMFVSISVIHMVSLFSFKFVYHCSLLISLSCGNCIVGTDTHAGHVDGKDIFV